MKSWKRYIPDGMKDLLFEDCMNKRNIEDSLRKIYLQNGFSEVVSPTLEFYDVFQGGMKGIEQEKMYKFFDRDGRIIVLRPDMTTPIGRIAGTKLSKEMVPLRLSYTSNVFRLNDSYDGKLSEITQSGVEIIGAYQGKADVEIICLGIKALIAIGLKDFKIELGDANYFKGIMEEVGLEEEEEEDIRKSIERKNFAVLSDFLRLHGKTPSDEAVKILHLLPQLFGGTEVLELARSLTKNEKAMLAIENLENITNTLDKLGLGEYITIDLGMVHQQNYYTGLIFRGYSSGIGNDIISGGRYDHLIEDFGESCAATGFAIQVDNILEVLKKQGRINPVLQPDYMIYFETVFVKEAYQLAASIQSKGFRVELSPTERLSEALTTAKNKRIPKLLSLEKEKYIKVYDGANKEFIEQIAFETFILSLEAK